MGRPTHGLIHLVLLAAPRMASDWPTDTWTSLTRQPLHVGSRPLTSDRHLVEGMTDCHRSHVTSPLDAGPAQS